ncbi:hypothetical protein LP418_26650 [Nocardioides sp. B-3]|nr:hypothetical protein LP418_26650 [Nocardioides sp. B-3]
MRENTHELKKSRLSYAEAANLAVNQTLVRSINTSIVALIPVAAILYVGVVQLGSGSLKDLALALFVGMAVGAYSSIFIATPLLVQLKANEKDVHYDERRAAARRREAAADPYSRVSAADRNATPPPDPRQCEKTARWPRGPSRRRRGRRKPSTRAGSRPRPTGRSSPVARPVASSPRASRGPSGARSEPGAGRHVTAGPRRTRLSVARRDVQGHHAAARRPHRIHCRHRGAGRRGPK